MDWILSFVLFWRTYGDWCHFPSYDKEHCLATWPCGKVFQLDSASPYFFHHVCAFLDNEFPDHWIRRGGPISWSHHPPDLHPVQHQRFKVFTLMKIHSTMWHHDPEDHDLNIYKTVVNWTVKIGRSICQSEGPMKADIPDARRSWWRLREQHRITTDSLKMCDDYSLWHNMLDNVHCMRYVWYTSHL